MNVKLYEKKESLESMILGINRDPYRENFHAYLKSANVNFESEVLSDSDSNTLIVEIDGKKESFDHYPNAQETATLFGVDIELFKTVQVQSNLLKAANTTRLGNCCGVGEDIYVDPNEEM